MALSPIFPRKFRCVRRFFKIKYIPDHLAGADRLFQTIKLSATVVWQDGNSLYIGPNLPVPPVPEPRMCGKPSATIIVAPPWW